MKLLSVALSNRLQHCDSGCSGPTENDCIPCKFLKGDIKCKRPCLGRKIYNPIDKTCVVRCPGGMGKKGWECVKLCPPGKQAIDGNCFKCEGPCLKVCPSYGNVNFSNYKKYQGCNIIEGSLEINFHTFHYGFDGQAYARELHPDRLEVFSSLKEITGFLKIHATHDDFHNLSCFRNLEVIGGRELEGGSRLALFISEVRTSVFID